MSNKIILKHSTVPGSVPLPDDLAIGEIAMNVADGRLFAKIPSGEIEEFAKSATIKSFAGITGDVGSIEATRPAETLTIKGGDGVRVTAMHATNEIVVALNNADAATLGGHAASYFATATHLHDDRYLKLQVAGGDYYTQAQVDANITTAIDNLINGAGSAYDTLKELEAALLDNDSDIAVINSTIATKLDATAYNAADVLTKLKTVDGATSGLDADLLDGQHGAFYRNAKNLNAGTLPVARLSGIYDIGVSGNAATATKLVTPITLALTGDVSGSIALDGSSNATLNVSVANDSHTHDARYYEKSVADGRFLGINAKAVDADKLDGHDASEFQLIMPTSQKKSLPVGWYTIAVNYGDRAIARFGLRDIDSSDHQSCVFYASHHYGKNSEITVLHSGRYSGTPIRHLRIKEGGTYDGAMLQVYLDQTSNTVQAFLYGENFQEQGWTIKDWIPDGTDPGGLKSFAKLTNTAAQVNLDNIMDGGMATTGQMFIGGKTTQYKVWHAGNGGPGSGLNADLLDGKQLSVIESDYAAADASTLASAKSYADTQDSAALSSANAYTDAESASALSSAKSYADTQDAATLVSAKSYADSVAASQAADAVISANSYTDTQVAALIDTAPGTLDTLNELAAALGDDPNFATTISNQISLKLDAAAYTAADVLAKLKTVDGAGSGLDADLLDGRSSAYFATKSEHDAHLHDDRYLRLTGGDVSGLVTMRGDGEQIRMSGSSNNADVHMTIGGADTFNWQLGYRGSTNGVTGNHLYLTSSPYNTGIKLHHDGRFDYVDTAGGAHTVWHANNDGVDSGLDADLLDGKQLSAIESEYASADAATLAEAKSYSDVHLTTAQSYADSAAAGALASANSYTDTQVAALVDASPGTLDTLNELAAALGDDPNFATTISNQIGLKLDATAYTAADVRNKLKTVDGSGSGIDADLLDGKHASAFSLTSHTHSSSPGPFTIDGFVEISAPAGLFAGNDLSFVTNQGTSWVELRAVDTKGFTARYTSNSGTTWSEVLTAYVDDTFQFKGNQVWHAGHQGAGTGMDADTLDGKHAADLATADHLHDERYVNKTGDNMTGPLGIDSGTDVGFQMAYDPATKSLNFNFVGA